MPPSPAGGCSEGARPQSLPPPLSPPPLPVSLPPPPPSAVDVPSLDPPASAPPPPDGEVSVLLLHAMPATLVTASAREPTSAQKSRVIRIVILRAVRPSTGSALFN